MKYFVNEVFYSVQGEGKRAGDPSVFVRFTGCNMRCAQEAGPKSPGGFDCDTEFTSGKAMTLEEIEAAIIGAIASGCEPTETVEGIPMRECPRWLVLTGGEPGLQVNAAFCEYFHERGFLLAIETNGSVALPMRMHPQGLGTFDHDEFADGAMPSPARVLERTRMCALADVLACSHLDWITVSPKVAEHAIRQVVAHEVKYVRGAGQAVPRTNVKALHYLLSPAFNGLVEDREAIATCIALAKSNPQWALSVQLHKSWRVR